MVVHHNTNTEFELELLYDHYTLLFLLRLGFSPQTSNIKIGNECRLTHLALDSSEDERLHDEFGLRYTISLKAALLLVGFLKIFNILVSQAQNGCIFFFGCESVYACDW